MSVLTQEQLKSFGRDGFLVVRGMYDAAEVSRISDWIDALCRQTPEFGKEMFYFETSLADGQSRILSRVEYFVDFHPFLSDLACGEGRMKQAVSSLLGEEAVLFKEKINFKKPGGDGFKPHQDIQPGWDDYAPYFISVLVTIDESTPANGCLELAAGHHTRGLIGRRWQPLEGAELDGIHFEKYPMAPGDVAFFDCFVPHQSAPNRTAGQRRNLYLTYNRKSDGDHRLEYFEAKRRNFPPDNERIPGKQYVFKV